MVFDNAMLEALSDLAGGPLLEWAWLKASLPSSLGGLNIRRASLHAPAAYISSLDQSKLLVAGILGRVPEASQHLAPALLDLATAADRHDWRSIEDVDVPLRQRHLSHSIDEASYIHLITGAPDTRSKALALFTAIPHAGDWLNVIPSHALAALAPRKEVPSLIPGTSSRPADVYLPNWMRGQPAALDVHVISTLQQLTLKEAAVTQGHALSVGEERKRAAHSEACHAVGVTFIPMVVETLGEVGVRRQLSEDIRIFTLDGFRASDWEATRHLFQRLAINLWRGNATLWICRLPARYIYIKKSALNLCRGFCTLVLFICK